MENIIDRLEMYMKFRGLNDNKITVQAGLSHGLLGKAREKRKGLHSDSVEKILNAYVELCGHWLMTGEGKMLNEEIRDNENMKVKLVHNGGGHNIMNGKENDASSELNRIKTEAEILKREAEMLRREIEMLKGQIVSLDRDKEFLYGILNKK